MHLVVNLQRMFLPSELAMVITEEIDNMKKKQTPFHERSITIDRTRREPFNIRAILSSPNPHNPHPGGIDGGETNDSSRTRTTREATVPRRAKIGNETYTIFNLRRDIIELNLFEQLASDENPTSEDILWEEKDVGVPWNTFFDSDKVKVAMGTSAGKDTENTQARVFYNTLLGLLSAVIINNYAGMLRALGFSTMAETSSSSTGSISTTEDQTQYWSSTLACPHLPIICRSHPNPMSNRSMDLLPLLILADGQWRGLVKENKRAITVSENLGGHVAINRMTYGRDFGTYILDLSNVVVPIETSAIRSFISNCRLARYTGRYSYLRGFPQALHSKSDSNNDDTSHEEEEKQHIFPFGVQDFDDEKEREQFLAYTASVIKVNKNGRKVKQSMKTIFSQQHYGEIPGTMKTTFEDFNVAFDEGITPVGQAITDLLFSDDCDSGLNHSPTCITEIHLNQKRLLETLERCCVGQDDKRGCDPGRSTTVKDWKFLCQQEYIDITSCVDIPGLEPTSVRTGRHPNSTTTTNLIVEVRYNKEIPPVDANIDAFNPSHLVLGHGSKQTLLFMQSLMPKENGKLTPFVLFRESLRAMRDMTHEQLAVLGLGKAKNPVQAERSQPIIYDLVTGRVFSILFFEHYMCKYFLLLRHLFPHSTMVQDPNPDSHFCHPEHPSNAILPRQLPILYTLFSKCVNSFNDAAISSLNMKERGAFFPCTQQQNKSITFSLPRLICYPNESKTRTVPRNKVVHDVSANYRLIRKTTDGTYEKVAPKDS